MLTKLAAWWGPKISARRVLRQPRAVRFWGSGFGLPAGSVQEEPIIIATVAALDGFDKTIGASHESGCSSKHIGSQLFQIKADIEGQRLRRISDYSPVRKVTPRHVGASRGNAQNRVPGSDSSAKDAR